MTDHWYAIRSERLKARKVASVTLAHPLVRGPKEKHKDLAQQLQDSPLP